MKISAPHYHTFVHSGVATVDVCKIVVASAGLQYQVDIKSMASVNCSLLMHPCNMYPPRSLQPIVDSFRQSSLRGHRPNFMFTENALLFTGTLAMCLATCKSNVRRCDQNVAKMAGSHACVHITRFERIQLHVPTMPLLPDRTYGRKAELTSVLVR